MDFTSLHIMHLYKCSEFSAANFEIRSMVRMIKSVMATILRADPERVKQLGRPIGFGTAQTLVQQREAVLQELFRLKTTEPRLVNGQPSEKLAKHLAKEGT